MFKKLMEFGYPVTLKYVSGNELKGHRSLQPQTVSTSVNCSTKIYLDSVGNLGQNYPPDMDFTTRRHAGDFSSAIIKDGEKLSLDSGHFTYAIPNINGYNNTLTFRAVATDYTCSIPEGYYATPIAVATAWAVAMSAVSPHVFVANIHPTYLLTTQITTAVAWLPVSGSAMDAQNCYNFPILTSAGSPIVTIGPMFLKYTRYIDVMSTALTLELRAASAISNTNRDPALIGSIMVPGNQWELMDFEWVLSPKYWNWSTSSSCTKIDITLKDDQGRELYNPTVHGATLPVAVQSIQYRIVLDLQQ